MNAHARTIARRRRPREERTMKFLVSRASQGAVSKRPPCQGAVRGPEAAAWPGEYPWFVELNSLEDLMKLLDANGGAMGVFAPEDGEDHPVIEIFDEDEGEG
jgi:hypothetical protein